MDGRVSDFDDIFISSCSVAFSYFHPYHQESQGSIFLLKCVMKSLTSKNSRHLKFFGRNNWSINFMTPREISKNHFLFQTSTKNVQKVGTIYKTKNAKKGQENFFI